MENLLKRTSLVQRACWLIKLRWVATGALAAVQSCLEIVFNEVVGPLNEKQRDLMERACRRASKCLALIIGLLKLPRMKLTGRLEMERFSLRNCIFNSLASVQNKAQSKSILVSQQIDPAVNEALGEAVHIEETLTNMLSAPSSTRRTTEGSAWR